MKISNKKLFVKTLIIVFGVYISCKNEFQDSKILDKENQTQGDLPELGGQWELMKVNDEIFLIEDVYVNSGGQPNITVDINKKTIGGFTGCNSWGSNFKLNKNTLELVGPIEMSVQRCPGNWESEFLSYFTNNQSITIEEGYLKLTSDSNENLIFKKI